MSYDIWQKTQSILMNTLWYSNCILHEEAVYLAVYEQLKRFVQHVNNDVDS